ncbi:hypothetical protein APHAL10511_000106 [Amanita phalloides]|nr:hypothetical protein APHAL10511_000106 [Amanita phalloides]
MAFLPQHPQFPLHHAAFSFQPQSTWGGVDYYRAHALNPEISLYEDAWRNVRDRNTIMNTSLGIGMSGARRWHHHAYEIPGEINRMSPVEIGHAAAYEAYKTWLRNSAMYEVLGEDRERQREGLVGIAVAEVTRLLQYSARHTDRYAQTIAADAAAHTVTLLFYQGQDDYSRSHSRMRAASYAGSQIIDPMDEDIWPERSRSRSRSRSHSRHGYRHYSASPSPHRHRHRSHSRSYADYPPVGMMPGQMSYSSSYAGYPSSQSSYNGTYTGTPWSVPTPINSAMTMGSNPIYPSSYPSQPLSISYPGQPMAMSNPYQTPVYNNTGVMTIPSSSRRNSIGYPMSYPGTAYSGASVGTPSAQPTVVILESKRKHRHHRHK